MKLGIIGTAGRGYDGDKLTTSHWNMMCFIAIGLAHGLKTDYLVSGGAAWGDAVAVKLYLEGIVSKLSLHLPAKFDKHSNEYFYGNSSFDTGRTSNYYHKKFSDKLGINSLSHIGQAILKCDVMMGRDFKERNTLIANEANALLAFTFGDGPTLKDGGTLDTMKKFLNKRDGEKRRIEELDLNGALHGPPVSFRAFHLDLNIKKLFEL